MSVRTLTANLLVALATLCGFASVQAQEYFPAADPFAFDPDFRWFEPVSDMDLADMKPKKRANTGWFATYDRLHLYGSRPEIFNENNGRNSLDSGWGHRYEVGYMLPDVDNGWLFNWTSNDVTASFVVPRERLNRVNVGDLSDPPDGLVGPPFGQIVPQDDQNTPGLNTRTYFIGNTENQFEYDSYELNKTWRMEPYHYGGILEPMVGIRWSRITDTNARDQYSSTTNFGGVLLQLPDGQGGFVEDAEQFITDVALTENEVLAGQLGFRYTKFRDRFIFSSDVRVFSGGAFQLARSNRFIETTIYDGAGVGAEVDQIIKRAEQAAWTYERNEEFVIGFDVRGELAYQLTKSISVRGGFQVIDFARGIWRGGSATQNAPLLNGGRRDQDLLMVGGTFGLTLNR